MSDTERSPGTLPDFLFARIAEREADPWWPDLDIAFADRAVGADEAAALKADEQRWETFVRAECEAKRRIAERAANWHAGADSFEDGYDTAMEEACRLLALPYADHPDYREEWRP